MQNFSEPRTRLLPPRKRDERRNMLFSLDQLMFSLFQPNALQFYFENYSCIFHIVQDQISGGRKNSQKANSTSFLAVRVLLGGKHPQRIRHNICESWSFTELRNQWILRCPDKEHSKFTGQYMQDSLHFPYLPCEL